jgi:hypothetical protein
LWTGLVSAIISLVITASGPKLTSDVAGILVENAEVSIILHIATYLNAEFLKQFGNPQPSSQPPWRG